MARPRRIFARSWAAVPVLAALAGAPSSAAASPMPFTGTLSLEFGSITGGWVNNGNTFVPFQYPFSGVADVSGGQLHLPAGAVSVTGASYALHGYPLGLLTGVVVTVSNGAGTIGPSGAADVCPGPFAGGGACVVGGGFGGKMPLTGLFQLKGALGFGVPLPVVGAGVGFGPLHFPTSTVFLSGVQGASWTTRTARVTTTGPNHTKF